ncbi:MFS transporter [Kineococcus sp. R86509]|uniref:MFS transporter n=1 Tax=Kineococcus sp. R86509 TaxID=3093851 RepID=UPI0036D33DFB
MRRSLLTLTAITFVTWIGARMSAVALPLVALEQTGQVWTMGLVGGMAGLPLLSVGWWGRGLRERLTDGRQLAAVMLLQAGGLAVVPVAGLAGFTGGAGTVVLCASGLFTGIAAALLGPAERALVSDLSEAGDLPGTASGAVSTAPRWLAWQDLAHRVSMIFAPPAGAWLVVVWGAQPLLWCEAAVVTAAAVAMLTVETPARPALAAARGSDPSGDLLGESSVLAGPVSTVDTEGEAGTGALVSATPSMRSVLRAHPQIAAGVVMAGVGGVCWFGFSLGLAVLGVELAMPGELIAAGMSGYGAASVLTSLLVPLVITRLPRGRTMVTSWVVLGLTFIALPVAAPSLVAIAAVSAVGGAAMPWGIAALNALISEQTSGAQRRAAFTAETILHSGGASLGLLVGGAIIGWVGAEPVLVVTGLAQILAGGAGVLWSNQHVAKSAVSSGSTPGESRLRSSSTRSAP